MHQDLGGTDGQPLRVAHVTEAPLGGVLSYLQEVICDQAKSDGVESVHVLVPEVNAQALKGIDDPKVVISSFEHSRGSPLGLLRLAASSVRLMREVQPDVLHVHSTFAGAIVRPCALLVRRRPKIVYCPHGWAFSREGSAQGPIVTVERLLALCTDRIVCISDFERREAVSVGISPEKLIVVENGIREIDSSHEGEAATREPPVGSRLMVLFVGRFDRQKGFDTFLEVMRRLGDRAEGLAVGDYLVGQADQRPAIPDNVTVLGWQPRGEVLRLYRHADLLLVPSRWEGFGLVAVEAMRSRLGVFASRVGGLQEVVADRVTGRLFDQRQEGEIVGMLEEADRETLKRYGERGYGRFLERFTASRMNRRLLELYASLVRRPRNTELEEPVPALPSEPPRQRATPCHAEAVSRAVTKDRP